MRHTITRSKNTIEIELTGFDEASIPVFGLDKKCGTVHQECGPERYATLESLTASVIPGGIKLEVSGRRNFPLDIHEAEQCLEHAVDYLLAEECGSREGS